MNNLRSKHILLIKYGEFMSYYKKKKELPKNSTKPATWKLVLGSRIKHKFYWKIKLLKQADCTRYVICRATQILFYRGFFEN